MDGSLVQGIVRIAAFSSKPLRQTPSPNSAKSTQTANQTAAARPYLSKRTLKTQRSSDIVFYAKNNKGQERFSSLSVLPYIHRRRRKLIMGDGCEETDRAAKRQRRATHHTVYLAIIAVLVIVLVYASAQAFRARQIMQKVEKRFGLRAEVRSSLPRAEPLREISAKSLLREKTFEEYRKEVDGLVERALELREFGGRNRLSEACAHALRGGKRLRPIIIMEVVRAGTLARQESAKKGDPPVDIVDPADAALFIEYLHTASLVIDDLPAFDDDNERRGKAAVHAKESPAVAHMAALSLVSAAFQDLSRQIDWIRDNCPEFKNVDRVGTRLCYDVGRAIGALGAAGGQFMDSSLSPNELFSQYGGGAVLEIVQLKTATFFEISFLTGWLIVGGSAEEAVDLQQAGHHFGTAFQIADDIGDMAQDSLRRAAGKPGWNYANEYGADKAARAVTQNLDACRLILEEKKLYTPLWKEIYKKVWEMAAP
ncbi:geranylgeranyl pyrophosphate synthase [Elysia marginata]|uniref:Geranylgeranyl pyrophosphate synthase n=1 Tax=Elysia marginata TaxID=1093978 RepID=A0AAV4GQR3_9GAST|nr:geranylgeranyl pyrophosphate synthase [Elysia marginata]